MEAISMQPTQSGLRASRKSPMTDKVRKESQAELTRLLRQYKKLSWATSAAQQTERAAMQEPLMELYRDMHPDSRMFHHDDDFDVFIRTSTRS
jgi:hypothetical protein